MSEQRMSADLIYPASAMVHQKNLKNVKCAR